MAGGRATRRESRKRALDVLYEADLKERVVEDVLAVHVASEDPPSDFATELVRGVAAHQADLDELIQSHVTDWKVGRMPVIDRNLLRMGLYEILHVADIPNAVAINEAVELAKDLSTDASGRFINGVLARLAAEHPDTPPE